MPTPEQDLVLSLAAQEAWRGKLETGRFFEVVVDCLECPWRDICLVSDDRMDSIECLGCRSPVVATTPL